MSNYSFFHGNLVEEWNDYLSLKVVPNTIIVAMFLVLGVVGNGIVLYVYSAKAMRREERFFIPILALVDMMACIFTAITAILENVHIVNYPSRELCKLLWFLTFVPVSISQFLLLIIAIQRYLKICNPLGRQMTRFWKRAALLTAFSNAIVYGIPYLFIAETIPSTGIFRNHTVVGIQCTYGSTTYDTLETVTFALHFGSIILNCVVMSVLYTFVGRVIYKTYQVNGNESRPKSTDRDLNVSLRTDIMNRKPPLKKKSSHRLHERNRFSLMLIAILVIYVLSEIPVYVVQFASIRIDAQYFGEFSAVNLNLFLTARRFFILNNVINPFIYGCFDTRFRHEMLRITDTLIKSAHLKRGSFDSGESSS